MPTHVSITDPDIHEPKGASDASADTVYVADGSGSGTWKKVDSTSLDYSDLLDELQADIDSGDIELTGKYFLTAVLPDVSTVSAILIPIPIASTLLRARLVLGGPITVANASIGFKNSAGASMGTPVTVAFTSSAKGDTYTFTASGNNVFGSNTWIEVDTDGASTDPQPVSIVLELSGILNG